MSALLRLELFVQDVERSVHFYERVLHFEVDRRDEEYASLRMGDVVLGLVSTASLTPTDGPGVAWGRLSAPAGAGVEIVLEVDDLGLAVARVMAAEYPLAEPVRSRPWGLDDFRLFDPDGYYLRITHGPR